MGKKLLIQHDNVPGIETLEVYRQHGGYASVEKALKSMAPNDVVEEVKKSKILPFKIHTQHERINTISSQTPVSEQCGFP